MRLVTYRTTPAGQARLGAVVGERVVDLARLGAVAGVPLPEDMLAFIDLGPDAVSAATQEAKKQLDAVTAAAKQATDALAAAKATAKTEAEADARKAIDAATARANAAEAARVEAQKAYEQKLSDQAALFAARIADAKSGAVVPILPAEAAALEKAAKSYADGMALFLAGRYAEAEPLFQTAATHGEAGELVAELERLDLEGGVEQLGPTCREGGGGGLRRFGVALRRRVNRLAVYHDVGAL